MGKILIYKNNRHSNGVMNTLERMQNNLFLEVGYVVLIATYIIQIFDKKTK